MECRGTPAGEGPTPGRGGETDRPCPPTLPFRRNRDEPTQCSPSPENPRQGGTGTEWGEGSGPPSVKDGTWGESDGRTVPVVVNERT